MLKSYPQQMIEADKGQEIDKVLTDLLQKHKGTKHLLLLHVGLELGVSQATVVNWCKQYGIPYTDYR